MIWVLRKFGFVISMSMALLGALYLPADFLERDKAITVATRTFTVGNREIILTVLCVALIARLAYMDFRRSINDRHWPPVRAKLRYALGVVFKGDRRRAELMHVTENPELATLYDAGTAKVMLLDLSWRKKVAHIKIPDTHDKFLDNIEIASATREICRRRLMYIGTMLSDHSGGAAFSRLVADKAAGDKAEYRADDDRFPSPKWRDDFNKCHALVERTNQIISSLEDILHDIANQFERVKSKKGKMADMLWKLQTRMQP